MHFYNNFRKECLHHGRFDNDALPPVVLCRIVVAILHVSHKTGYVHGYISMDIPVDIHEKNLWIWMENFIPRQAW